MMAASRSIGLPRVRAHITVGPREQAAIVMVTMTLAYCLSRYHLLAASWVWTSVLFFVVLPLVVMAVLRAKPGLWGLGVGEWRLTLGFTVVGLAAAALLLVVSHYLPTMQAFYRPLRPAPESLGAWLLLLAIEMLAWEFFWRGFGLFGLEPALGRLAVFVPMIPFALAHLHKPEVEALTSIVGAIVLGLIVLKCRSIWPAFIVHFCFCAGMFFI
jgi:hypothetical protein